MKKEGLLDPRNEDARLLHEELWLLRAGDTPALERCRAAFGALSWARVLGPPEGDEQSWATGFARTAGLAPRLDPRLAMRGPEESAENAARRALTVLEDGAGTTLAVLPVCILESLVALALGFTPSGPSGLRVDPGHAVLLLSDRRGWTLRRSNVASPGVSGGMGLPGGRA